MANKQISDLQARTFDGDSIIAHDVENTDPSTMAQKPYLTGSATGHAVADFVGNGEIYTTDLNTVDKHINGAINELHAINGYSYDAYDDTATYAVDDLCIYNNVLYKAKQATTGNLPTNTTYWAQTSIADQISELKPIIVIENLTIFDNQSINANTEYNQSGITVPQKTGYTVAYLAETRASGYYGSRIVAYAWLTTANTLDFSCYNPSSTNATVKLTTRVVYIKNEALS